MKLKFKQVEDWIKEIDDKWININLKDIQIISHIDYFEWDAQTFAGLLSFTELYISLSKKEVQAKADLNLDFLSDPKVFDQLVYSLKDMLSNTRLQENMEDSWEEWEVDIRKHLLTLEKLNA